MPDYKRLVRGKIRTRKIGQEQTRSKTLVSKIVLLVVLVVLVAVAVLAGRSFLQTSPYFTIKQVVITNQQGKLLPNPEDFFRLQEDYNLFSFDMQRITLDIRARHPETAAVSIHKQFPNKLLIVVEQREPLAVIVLRDSYLVDKHAFIMPFESSFRDLPKIIGVHPKQITAYTKTTSLRVASSLKLLEELKKTKVYPEYPLSQIDIREYQNLVFSLKNGIVVKMGQGDFARKAILLSKILARLREEKTLPEYIDMRFDKPVVKH